MTMNDHSTRTDSSGATPRVRGVDLCIIIVHHSPLRYRYVHHSPLRYRYGDRQCLGVRSNRTRLPHVIIVIRRGFIGSGPGRVASRALASLISIVSLACLACLVSRGTRQSRPRSPRLVHER